MMHFVSILGIAFLLYIAYLTFFKNFAKHQWEKGRILFLPEDLHSFVIAYKILVVMALLLMITMYILVLKGVSLTPQP